jgi:outer membrane protein TolC
LIGKGYLVELALADSLVIAIFDQEIAAQQRLLDSNRRWLIPNFSFSVSAEAFLYGTGDGPDYQEANKEFRKFRCPRMIRCQRFPNSC